jgi:hypothetical protein
MIVACVDVAAKALLHSALEKYAMQNDYIVQGKQSTAVFASPDRTTSTEIPVLTPALTDSVNEVFVVDDNDVAVSEDDQSIGSTTD